MTLIEWLGRTIAPQGSTRAHRGDGAPARHDPRLIEREVRFTLRHAPRRLRHDLGLD